VEQPLNRSLLPGLDEVLANALNGQRQPEQLLVTLEPNERFYFAIPYLDEAGEDVPGVGIIHFENLPTAPRPQYMPGREGLCGATRLPAKIA
jgi:hypothetical protein